MINLVIDMGNSLTKIALFNNRTIGYQKSFPDFNTTVLEQFIAGRQIDCAIISSVARQADEIERFLQSRYTYIRFSTALKSSIKINYKTPQTLGLDRFAVVIAAAALFPERNVLIIDAGTCITYDMVDSEKNYYGGSISPGIAMRFKAMHTFTKRLPLVDPDEEFSGAYGYDTHTSILCGVQQGVYNEAIGFIQAYTAQYPQLQVLLCGGDANFFDSRLKNSIFAHSFKTEPNLVLTGLNEVIYQHND